MSYKKKEKQIPFMLKMNFKNQIGFLKSILDSPAEYSIIAIDLNGVILAVNANTKRLHSYTPN